ncbi:MAG TPA: YcxB family protein [Propionibacterium sp.]|nr:YcxB family protein [Propionibacterium sp.]
MVNPVVGVGCGLALGAALFLIAVQVLFGVGPSLLAVLLAVAAVVGYGLALLRARAEAQARRVQRVVLDEHGVTVDRDRFAWSRFTRWLEDEADFVLASGGVRGRLLVVLPKAGIDEDEQELLREVLHASIDPDDEPLEGAFVEMNWDEEPARRIRKLVLRSSPH